MCGFGPNSLFVFSCRKSEPLSDDEDWNRQDWDMNILEPVVEISDQPKDNSRKRKRKENSGEPRKRRRPLNSARMNGSHLGSLREGEFIDVSIKQEPIPMEEVSHSVPMATLPVGNTSASSLPVYQVPTLTVYVPQPQPVVLQHPVGYSVQNTDNVLLNEPQNRNSPSTSAKTNDDIHSEVDLETNIKQEEMENVFVVPFGADIQADARPGFKKPLSPEPDITECESPEETVRKNRMAAIAENIGLVSSSSSHKKLRDLTFKLVELNNKNLQCATRIDKIKEEFRKRLQVVEIEKKGIEQEIDKVLASIQDWKEGRKEVV